MNMSIIHWNIQSYTSNFTTMKTLLQEHNPLGICLQETRQGKNKLKPPSGYTSIDLHDDGNFRGVAILINKTLHTRNVVLNTNLEAVATRLWTGGKWYTVCSLYLHHQTVSLADMESLVNQLPPPFPPIRRYEREEHPMGRTSHGPQRKSHRKTAS